MNSFFWKTILLCVGCGLFLINLNANAAGRGTAGKQITKIFNKASGAAKKIDPPPKLKHEYNPPKIKRDAEKVSIEDWKKIHNQSHPKP
jgi:hypothetical protein